MKTESVFQATVHAINFRKDGGGRITLEFSADSLDEVQAIQKIATLRNCFFNVVLVPGQPKFSSDDVDPMTGEILI